MTRHPLPLRRRPRRPVEAPLDDGASAQPAPSAPDAPRWHSHPVELLGEPSLKEIDPNSWFGGLFGP